MKVIFGETSSTGGLRVSLAISAYVRVSVRMSRYALLAGFTATEKTSLSALATAGYTYKAWLHICLIDENVRPLD